jgi:hypothetical protein
VENRIQLEVRVRDCILAKRPLSFFLSAMWIVRLDVFWMEIRGVIKVQRDF